MSVECATTPKTGYCFSTSSKVMIIVAQGEEFLKGGIRSFVGKESIPCPICTGRLKVHGTCLRKLRNSDGEMIFRLRVMECRSCGRTHRELPAQMVPYKRTDVNGIANIADVAPSEHLTVCETSTWKRVVSWVRWFLWYAQKIQEGLFSLATDFSGQTLAEQLAYNVRLVVNSGNWIQHRSAQNPGYFSAIL